MPSRRSSVAASTVKAWRSKRRPLARSVSMALSSDSLARRTASGALRAMAWAICTARSTVNSGWVISLTRPACCAVRASMGSPVSTICMAMDLPTARSRRWVPPAPGMMPRLISGWPKRASTPATMMSACIASSQPPPRAKPLTAATRGLLKRLICCQQATRGSLRMPTASRSAISLMSAPAANALRLPVSTTARQLSSRSRRSSSAASSPSRRVLRALSTSGRCSVTRQMPAWELSSNRVSGMTVTARASRGWLLLLGRGRLRQSIATI